MGWEKREGWVGVGQNVGRKDWEGGRVRKEAELAGEARRDICGNVREREGWREGGREREREKQGWKHGREEAGK